MKHISTIILFLFLLGCSKEPLFSDNSRHDFWLLHEGADLPIIVEGNTNSKIFLILLHGGPGGTAQEFNATSKPFTDPLEEDYAMVYYDQRNAGLARGEWVVEKLTIAQHVEDLDKVIEFLKHQFGEDITLFLAGHSWGGYLGTAYVLDPERQNKVKAWININGNIHRNLRNFHTIETILTISEEQIAKNKNVEAWTELKLATQAESDRGIVTYNKQSEDAVFNLGNRAIMLINQDKEVSFNTSEIRPALVRDNYDPFLTLTNDRKGTLIEQMYAFDENLEAALSAVEIPVLSIYGKYDFTTPALQGDFLINNIGTLENDKNSLVLEKSGHSSMKNEPLKLANEISSWIETYR